MVRIGLVAGAVLAVLAWSSHITFAQDAHEKHDQHHEQGHQEGHDSGKGEHAAGDHDAVAEAVCPVSGLDINKKFNRKYRDKTVYFCCNDCIGRFEKDPEKYADGVKAQWAAMKPLAIQVTCPADGKPISRKHSVEGDHGTVYFCGVGCKTAWQKDNSKMKSKLKDCFTYQTDCPIMGGEINPAVSAKIDGRTVYFCCPACEKGFLKDKAANFKKLDAQIAKNKAAAAKRHEG